MVHKFNILARRQCPTLRRYFCQADTAVQLRHFVLRTVCAFTLPCVVDVGGSFDLGGVEQNFFLVLALHRVLCPRAQIHKQNLMFAVAQVSAVVAAALFILVQDPKGHADVCTDKKLTRKNNDSLHLVFFNQLAANIHRVAVVQSAVGQQEPGNAVGAFQVREHMQNPRIVGVAFRRGAVVAPARVILQIAVIPAFQVERRICHDVVKVAPLVQVIQEGGIAAIAKVVADAAQGKVHFRKAVGSSFLFLTVYINAVDIPLLRFYQCGALDKHTAGTAAGVIQGAVKGFNHTCNQLHNIMRGVKLTIFLCGIDGEFLQEIFVHSPDQVFFLAKLLVADFVDLIHKFLNIIGGEVAGGKSTFHKAALQLFIVGRKAVQRRIQCNIQACGGRVDNGGPACFRRQVVGAVRKGNIIKESGTNILVVRVKALVEQRLAQRSYTVLVFLSDKAQKHKGQHHITFFKKRTGVAGSAQIITAVKQDGFQVQGFILRFLFGHTDSSDK